MTRLDFPQNFILSILHSMLVLILKGSFENLWGKKYLAAPVKSCLSFHFEVFLHLKAVWHWAVAEFIAKVRVRAEEKSRRIICWLGRQKEEKKGQCIMTSVGALSYLLSAL